MPPNSAEARTSLLHRGRFEDAYDRIVSPGKSSTTGEKARAMGIPPSSLSRMLRAQRPLNASAVLALMRLGFTAKDVDGTLLASGEPVPAENELVAA